jgi:hypothetical protein
MGAVLLAAATGASRSANPSSATSLTAREMAPVHVVTNTDHGLEITLVSGDRVRVSAGVSPDLVTEIVRALRRPC